ncbi:MAG: Type 1 glutamine amidotransferase-like domain-containing protein [Myxococcota bacterium]
MTGRTIILGPQRPSPNLPEALAELGGDGHVLLVSAGWRWDEGETGAVRRAIHEDVLHVPLYTWLQVLRERHPELDRLYAARQAMLLETKARYQVRLKHAVAAWAELRERAGVTPHPALEGAMAHIRSLDHAFVQASLDIHERAEDLQAPWEHPAMAEWVEKIRSVLASSRAVLVAGGHVGVLRQRMMAFGLGHLLREAIDAGTHLICWSAGAMALSEQIVLFYDDPPEGASHPEVFDTGFGLLPGAVWLPHARRRLRLDDPARVQLMAQRFAPRACIGLENGAWMELRDGGYDVVKGADRVLRLRPEGGVETWA